MGYGAPLTRTVSEKNSGTTETPGIGTTGSCSHLAVLPQSNGMSVIYPDEKDTLPAVLQLNYDIFTLAVRLGLLASEYRREPAPQMYDEASIGPQGFPNSRQADQMKRLFDIQHALRRVWELPGAVLLAQQADKLPHRSRELYQQVSDILPSLSFPPGFRFFISFTYFSTLILRPFSSSEAVPSRVSDGTVHHEQVTHNRNNHNSL